MVLRKSLPEWQQLEALAQATQHRQLRDMWADPARVEMLSFRTGPLLEDFSKQRLTAQELDAFAGAGQGLEKPVSRSSSRRQNNLRSIRQDWIE